MSTTREQLLKRHEDDLRKLELQERIEAALVGLPTPKHIHPGIGCWGDVAQISWGDRYGRESVTWPELLAVAMAFPGLPLYEIRDSCLSFQPRRYVESLGEAKRERHQSELEVCPWELRYDPNHYAQAYRVDWSADLPGVGQCGLSFEFRAPILPKWLGHHSAKRVPYPGGVRWKDQCLSPNQGVIGRIDRDGEPLAELQRPIKWSPGSSENLSSYTLYWVDLRNDRPATLEDFARHALKVSA